MTKNVSSLLQKGRLAFKAFEINDIFHGRKLEIISTVKLPLSTSQ
jgi:hypothetical protein